MPVAKSSFDKTDFEASPLSREEKNYAPGNGWVGSNVGIGNSYLLNTAADSVRIWNIAMTAGVTPTSTAFYTAGMLNKKVSVDERGYSTIESHRYGR